MAAFSSLFAPQEAVRADGHFDVCQHFGTRISGTGLTGLLNDAGGYSLAFFLSAVVVGVALLLVLLAYEQHRPSVRPALDTTGQAGDSPEVPVSVAVGSGEPVRRLGHQF
ncbi:MAG: hypothetical protein U0401_21755 [Anaerolineae bacterium]